MSQVIHVAQRHGIHYLALPGMLEANLGGEAMQIDATLHAWIVRLPANGAGQALLRHTNNEGQNLQCVKGWRCRCTHVTMTTGTETDGFERSRCRPWLLGVWFAKSVGPLQQIAVHNVGWCLEAESLVQQPPQLQQQVSC